MKDLPRRYGKESIEIDIKKQRGKATSTQEMMLELNDLKNALSKLNKRGINDMFTQERYFNDEESTRIKEIVRGAIISLEPYTNKKKNG